MKKYTLFATLSISLLSACSPKQQQENINSDTSQKFQLTEISKVLEKAYWQAESKRIADATDSKVKHTSWENFDKDHEVKIIGIHESDTDPPVLTGVIRIFIPSMKDSYYQFHFQSTSADGWESTEAYLRAPGRARNFYTDPFPNSKSLKEYLPIALKELGAPIITP